MIDFDEWVRLQNSTPIEEYYAVYNEEGLVTSIVPFTATTNLKNTVKIDTEIAHLVFDGVESLFSFRVNIATKEFFKVNRFIAFGLTKIDDVLHRIIDKKWARIDETPDLVVNYNRKEKCLKFLLNEKYNATNWEGETEMIFLVTQYNDPNQLIELLKVNVGDLFKKNFKLDLPEKFSVYTRRIFKNYVFEEV